VDIVTTPAKRHREAVDDVKLTHKRGNLYEKMLSMKDVMCLAWQ